MKYLKIVLKLDKNIELKLFQNQKEIPICKVKDLDGNYGSKDSDLIGRTLNTLLKNRFHKLVL